MQTEQLYALATKLETEELLGSHDQTLLVDDIFPVLEALAEHGVDLAPALHPAS